MARFVTSSGFWVLLFVAVFSSNKVNATLTSSYYDGSTSYATAEGLSGWIDFAVYDTSDDQSTQQYIDNGLEKPGEGRYLYAYQIFSSFFSQGDGVAYFEVLDIEGQPIDQSLMNGTKGIDDGQGGIAPSPVVSETQGLWKWTFEGGYIAAGQHSWFLVFSSDYDWTAGTYEIKGPDTVPVPVPEPATAALLGLGGCVLLRCSKHKLRKSSGTCNRARS